MIMNRSRNIKALVRTVGVVAAVMIIAGGVTFAALQSQQDTLAGNTIETATADLRLGTDGVNYSNSHAGFDFDNLVPGGQAVPTTGYPVYLENLGGTPLAIKLAVSSVPTNPNNVDLSKVNVLLTTVGSGTGMQSFNLQSLMAASSVGGLPINSGNIANHNAVEYKLQVSMDSDAISGSGATLGNIDFVFSGVAQSS
jgi:hypothetical protein